jgi:DNA-binding PadR family transcriptional regulator
MLILKIAELGPVHGYGISQRIRQISKEVQVQRGSLYPAFIVWKERLARRRVGQVRQRQAGQVL